MPSALRYLLCYFIVMFSPSSTIAQTSRNIFLGSSLIAQNDDNSSWPAPSGEFAFGFRQMGKDEFLLAIWFNKIQERTIVWSANRGNVVAQGSKVELTADGQFVLNDATGKQLWNADSAITGVDHAAMLDTGNFVLADGNSTTLWGSFDQPTNTILPTQTLNQSSELFAHYTTTNYSRGRFLLSLEADGNLVLYTTNFPQDSANSAYWSTKTDIGFQVIFNQSGHIYLTSRNGTILSAISSQTASMKDFYQRATLDSDRVLRHYVYPKSSSSSAGRWPLVWSASSFIPPNICTSVVEGVGSGACGFNSLCIFDGQRPTCSCPNGYSFIDPNDVSKGCKQNFPPQRCDETSPETALFEFQEKLNTNWPNADYAHFQEVSEDWCRQNCLKDCFCAVAIYNTGQCWKKRLPFSNGMIDDSQSIGGKALIKFRKVNSTERPEGRAKTEKKDNSTLILVLSLLLGSSVVLNFLLPLLSYLFGSKIYSRKFREIQPYSVMPGTTLKYFSYEELKKATNEFKEELGRGASATVFKGVLSSDEARYAAVKRLDNKVGENDLEFKSEVMAIGRTNHRNLVQLFGLCNEGQHRMLVYEFMSNGSLASFLFGEPRPNWYQRRQVALGIARGLLYLHEECINQIVHCDIKPQKILLDDNLSARIADFGLAKLFRLDQTKTMTAIRGTKGYVAPEWFKSLPITFKVDVYSYGILLLEIIFCREHFKATMEDENEMILADWAYDCFKEKELHRLFKTDDEAMNDLKVEKYVMIAIWCIQEDPARRPTMKKVTLMLEGTVEVSAPPDPYSFISSII